MSQLEEIIFRFAARPFGMLDGDLGDALGERIGQRRHECRLFVAGHHRVDDVPPIGPQHAPVVVHRDAHDQRGKMIMQPRSVAAIRPVLTLLAPSADDVVALIDRLDQPRNLFRRILQIAHRV